MTKVSAIRPITAVQPSQLKDDVVSIALANGFTREDITRMEKQDEYRRHYNARPDVVAKRKEYTHKRYLKMKALRDLLRG